MSDALALPVLHRLVGQRVHGLRGVPTTDRPAKRAAPAAETLDERGELEQVRARSGHLRQRVERGLAGLLVTKTRRHREREERRIVLRRTALVADTHDLGDRTLAVL